MESAPNGEKSLWLLTEVIHSKLLEKMKKTIEFFDFVYYTV